MSMALSISYKGEKQCYCIVFFKLIQLWTYPAHFAGLVPNQVTYLGPFQWHACVGT